MAESYLDNENINSTPPKIGTTKMETVYDAEIWGLENVYIFAQNKNPRGIIWVIPPPNITNVQYGDNPGFPGQNFAYDQMMKAVERGDIPEHDFHIVIAPTSEHSVEQCSDMAVKSKIFDQHDFDYYEHIDLCGCCTDEQDREFINLVVAMGDGCHTVNFEDPTLTNVLLIDPVMYPPVKIPAEFAPQVSMVHNPNNHDPNTLAGQASLAAQEQIAEQLPPDNVKDSKSEKGNFDFFGLLGAGLAALGLGAPNQGDVNISGDDPPWRDYEEPPYITGSISTQDPNEDKAGNNVQPPPSGIVPAAEFGGPQVIITSDRILLNAKQDSIVMSAFKPIGLSTLECVGIDAGTHFTVNAPEIYLGLGATEPLILGHMLGDWLDSLCNTIQNLTYTNSGGPTGPAVNASTLTPLRNSIPDLKSVQNYTL